MSSAQDFEKFFKMADKDGSGELSLEELVKAMRTAGFTGTEREIKKMFRAADTSGDDLVTLEEFLVAMGAIPEPNRKEARLRQLFRDYDTDGSGSITAEELKGVFKEMGRDLTAAESERMVFLMEGGDKDGKVDYEEFIKYYDSSL